MDIGQDGHADAHRFRAQLKVRVGWTQSVASSRHACWWHGLRRWSSLFPREQLYVGFYESIASRPQALLRDLFAYLGVNPDVDLSAFPVSQRVLPGLPGDLPRRGATVLHER